MAIDTKKLKVAVQKRIRNKALIFDRASSKTLRGRIFLENNRSFNDKNESMNVFPSSR